MTDETTKTYLPARAEDEAPASERVNVLLVDDRPSNRLSLKAMLERPDYNLVLAESGEEALDRVLRDDFAVILLDVAMPGMDGFEVAAVIKQRQRSSKIPILFITASVYDLQHIFRGYTVGAVDYLQKPVDPHAIRSKVEVFVALFRQARQIERQARRLREIEMREQELLRLRAEDALRASEARFRRLQESGLIGIYFWRIDGTVTEANDAFLKMIGYTRDELSAAAINWQELTPPEYQQADERATQQLLESGVCAVYEKEYVRKDGSRVFALVGGTLLEGSRDDGVGFVLDISERRRIEEERARLVQELSDAVRARDEFLSIAAHELKTPLTPLRLQARGLVRAIERQRTEELSPERLVRAIETVERSAIRLEHLIDRLLDVSQLTVGKLRLELEPVELAATVRAVVERLREEWERSGGTVTFGGAEPVVGNWDRMRIEQVISNLLGNAIKYGSGKPIEITVGGDDEVARLEVRDHGIGIPPEAQARIFERFERVVPVRHYAGFGLGLWIVRQIVEAHGGRIEVWSQPGEGSRFTVELPRALLMDSPGRDEHEQLPAGESVSPTALA